MPIYEFSCGQCGGRFEVLVRLGGEKDVICRACGSSLVKKLTSCFGIGGGGSRLKQSSGSCAACSSTACGTCRSN